MLSHRPLTCNVLARLISSFGDIKRVIFGAHCSTAGGVHKALQRAKSIGADSCQVFVKNNMQWRGRAHTAAELALYETEVAANSLKAVFGHTGYLINLGAPPSEN